jgi:phenylalanyl-tRNA synthetase beta chain
MKIPLSWLKKHLNFSCNVDELCHHLTDLGFEVESIENGDHLKPFIVAEIIEFEKHPNADKLNVCKVNNGSEITQIVCGASNVKKNMKTVLAPIGAVIPNGGFMIKKSNIRGIESNGMMCSASELNLDDKTNGIIELDNSFIVGESFSSQAGLDDVIIDIKITPNRADALSIMGIARDLSARNIGDLIHLNPNISGAKKTNIPVEIKSDNICKSIQYIKLTNIKNNETPDWIAKPLQKIGISSKNAVIDILNYIMFDIGQPMHAYDADKISGDFEVVKTGERATFKALNGNSYNIKSNSIIIKDGKSQETIAIAGIIGSEKSAISDNSKNIYIECGNFNPIDISIAGQGVNLQTDARFRFERGVDANLIEKAIDMAINLINDICKPDEISTSEYKSQDCNYATTDNITLNVSKIKKLLGVEIESETIMHILSKLSFSPNLSSGAITCKIPSWRYDISNENDIIEEIIRVYGYDKIPEETYFKRHIISHHDRTFDTHNKYRKVATILGYDEILSYSFNKLDNGNSISIFNPISSDMKFMRTSILDSLMENLQHRINIGENFVNIFELGKVFHGCDIESQIYSMSGIRFNKKSESDLHNKNTSIDIFDVKTDLYKIIGDSDFEIRQHQTESKMFHPYKTFDVMQNGYKIATFGQIHPIYLDDLGIKHDVVFFDIPNLSSISISKDVKSGVDNNLMSISKEMSFILSDDTKISSFINAIMDSSKSILSIIVKDIYRDEKMGLGNFSISIDAKIHQDKIMNSEEIGYILSKINENVKDKCNGILRGSL